MVSIEEGVCHQQCSSDLCGGKSASSRRPLEPTLCVGDTHSETSGNETGRHEVEPEPRLPRLVESDRSAMAIACRADVPRPFASASCFPSKQPRAEAYG